MKFFKDNSYDIVKLFVNQIGITIFSLVLYTAIGFIEDDSLFSKITIAVSVFSMLFYYVLLYTSTWDLGAKDIIRIEGGKIEKNRAKGALMSLIANLPNFLLALAAVVSVAIYMGSASDGAYTAFGVFNLLIRFTNAMYLGALQGIFSFLESNETLYFFWQSIGYLIAPALSILVTHLGYEAGLRNFRIFAARKPKKK